MKNLTKKYKPTLFNKMCDILSNFYDTNDLEHMCALESQISGNYKTEEQLEWLERFCEVLDQVDERDSKKRWGTK